MYHKWKKHCMKSKMVQIRYYQKSEITKTVQREHYSLMYGLIKKSHQSMTTKTLIQWEHR